MHLWPKNWNPSDHFWRTHVGKYLSTLWVISCEVARSVFITPHFPNFLQRPCGVTDGCLDASGAEARCDGGGFRAGWVHDSRSLGPKTFFASLDFSIIAYFLDYRIVPKRCLLVNRIIEISRRSFFSIIADNLKSRKSYCRLLLTWWEAALRASVSIGETPLQAIVRAGRQHSA